MRSWIAPLTVSVIGMLAAVSGAGVYYQALARARDLSVDFDAPAPFVAILVGVVLLALGALWAALLVRPAPVRVALLVVGCCALAAVALVVLAGETPWSLARAMLGAPGASSPDAEAARVKSALLSNDARRWSAVCPQGLDGLKSASGDRFTSLRWHQARLTPAADNPDNALAWCDVGGAGAVGFVLTRGALTGWRVDGYELSP